MLLETFGIHPSEDHNSHSIYNNGLVSLRHVNAEVLHITFSGGKKSVGMCVPCRSHGIPNHVACHYMTSASGLTLVAVNHYVS